MPEPKTDEFTFEVASMVSARTKQGAVTITLPDRTFTIPLSKAREIVGMLQGAIEAAVSDELVFRFLVERVGMPDDAAGRALIDFREMRQGSRGTVYPH